MLRYILEFTHFQAFNPSDKDFCESHKVDDLILVHDLGGKVLYN
jgi:hypothetical protein